MQKYFSAFSYSEIPSSHTGVTNRKVIVNYINLPSGGKVPDVPTSLLPGTS